MGLQASMKKEEKGVDAQASKRAEILKCRQTHLSKEIALSSLVGKWKGRGGDCLKRDGN